MSSDFVDRECIEKKLSAAKIFEVICIGRELLDGRVLDTNSHYIAQELKTLGNRLQFAQKVDDDPKRLKQRF